ncbi:MAG TPA: transcription termination/antitermination NusG family protein [Pyrinomonadaceae bacterium]|nr:transcription termination/antitermination NusG family protein [Pyrinomonadaceae bacterium]
MNAERWYVLYTKAQEEDRAEKNLSAWGIQTFYPRIKKKQFNQFTGKAIEFSRPLFPRYIFARFDAERILHKLFNTRGVEKVISFNGIPTAVDDHVIDLIQSKVTADGFVCLNDNLKPGDEVRINNGSLKGINGIFDRTLKDKGRIMILLNSINYQASLIVESDLVQKASYSHS